MRLPIRAAVTAVVIAGTALVACTPPTTGGGGSSTTTTRPATDPRTCPTRSAGQVRVAVVVDSSALGGPATPSVTCVVVASGATGVAALAARAIRLGTAQPRYDASGLLCAIDGKPVAPACGTPSGGSFEYWSYWIGGASWTYANVGPASRAMTDGTVEGWRFINGGSAVAPNASSSFAALTN